MNFETPYRSTELTPPAPVKREWTLPRNFKDRLDACGFLGWIFGLVFFITAFIFHAVMVPNDKIPHSDPRVVTAFLILAGVTFGLGTLILLGRITVYFAQVVMGKRDF
jgi:hypothetical protein